jgi:hypothetical protein
VRVRQGEFHRAGRRRAPPELEENPRDVRKGESFAAEVIDRCLRGPGWADTLLIWTYDENGAPGRPRNRASSCGLGRRSSNHAS